MRACVPSHQGAILEKRKDSLEEDTVYFKLSSTQGSVKREGKESCSTEAVLHEMREAEVQEMIYHLQGQSSLPIPTLLQSFELPRLLL